MALFTLSAGGLLFDVLEGTLALGPGAPIATLELPEDTAPDVGPADLLVAHGDEEEPERFVGTLVFAHSYEGRCLVMWSGGAGGLASDALATHYTAVAQPVALATVVEAIVAGAGELLDDGALDALAGLELPRWTRVAGETWSKALARALEDTGRTWRILDSGRVWIGVDTWPAGELGGEVLDEDTDARTLLVAFDRATLRPGTNVDGRRVVRVTFGSTGRADVELDDDTTGGGALARLVARHSKLDPYARRYLAEVVVQHEDDGTLDLRILDEGAEPWRKLPFEDLTRVPFWTGVQGARCVLPERAQVHVAFVMASPAGAVAFGRPTATGADRGVARKSDGCKGGTITIAGGPGGLVVTYSGPFGAEATGTFTAVDSATSAPITFAGSMTINLEEIIDTASEEVFLQ